MGNLAVRVEGLGKEYKIGRLQNQNQTFREIISTTFASPFRRARQLLRGEAYGAAGLEESIWALQDISFEVKHGEVVGIIGPNGAGKSTLLKVLSRITEPTKGTVDIYGRVGALLEVGTGFHQELTGRENIYLNGAILGMSRQDINHRFDEIVDFAGVEKFIDTPVKHYSSGMRLRLGFSVAAHLEPEILVIDEVLAVGDAEFQKKCIGKMADVAGEGRTVLFVSHNMIAVKSLCHRGILINQGRIEQIGDIAEVVHNYQSNIFNKSHEQQVVHGVDFVDIRLNGEITNTIDLTKPVEVEVTVKSADPLGTHWLFCIIDDFDDNILLHAKVLSDQILDGEPLSYRVKLALPPLWIRPNVYNIYFKLITASIGKKKRYLSEPIMLNVVGNSNPDNLPGYLTPYNDWQVLETHKG